MRAVRVIAGRGMRERQRRDEGLGYGEERGGCGRERARERESVCRRAIGKERERESGVWVKRRVRLAWLG